MCAMTLNGMLNTGLLGLYTNKTAMSVVAHNLSNANTPGYSRQTPIIVTNPPIYMTGLGSAGRTVAYGTGSNVSDIRRIRDEFLDLQYRETTSRLNYWDNIYSNIHYTEQLLGEPGETGIRNMYDSFWAAIEELKTDPSNEAAKAQIVSRADELINTMKDFDYRLRELQSDINSDIKLKTNQINSYLVRISDLNRKLLTSGALGTSPNDLLDERDRLLDELSKLSDIKVNSLANNQISITLGNQMVLNGSYYQEIKLAVLPGTQDTYQTYIGNNLLEFSDGTIAALFELRDEIIPSYRRQIDEFGLFLVDSTNLIYKEGWDATGTITGANFFSDLTSKKGLDDTRLFRIAGIKDVFHPNTIQYVTSLKSYNSNPNIVVTDLTDLKLYSITGDTNSPSQFMPDIKYNSASKALYLDTAGDDLKDQLIIDFGGNFLKEYGFATKEIGAYKISVDDVVSGSIEFTIDDNTYTIDFNDNTDLINNINSGTGGYLKAVKDNDFIYIVPTNKVPNNDIDTIVLNDIEGSLSEMNAQKITLDALDVSKPTLNNLLGTNEKVEMSINGIKIEIDPLKDTANDLVEKINATNMGVTASITPHGKFVLRAGNFVDFDLANVVIKGNANLFDALGLIEDSSNNIITITSPDLSPDRIESMFSKADLLRIDKEIGLINQISVSQNLMSNPSLLAIDLGIFDGNNYQPIGAGSVTVWDQITQLRYSPILDNGRLGFSDFLANMITEIGVKGETAQKMKLNSESLNSQITIERERVMGVSIDEEVTNLIKYQQAFNACARVITAIDQMLSTVVSSMGVV